jgi:hypothetical protein
MTAFVEAAASAFSVSPRCFWVLSFSFVFLLVAFFFSLFLHTLLSQIPMVKNFTKEFCR